MKAQPRLAIREVTTGQRVKRGCAITFLILFAPYALNLEGLLISSFLRQTWWRIFGETDYTLVISETSFGWTSGESILTVRQNEVVAVDHNGRSVAADQLQDWNSHTIDSQFGQIIGCALLFPLLTCSVHYDLRLGYPSELVINCPIPDACYTAYRVNSMRVDR